MKFLFLSTALLFLSIVSFAQYENIDLSEYMLPEIKRHQLDFKFNSGGSSQSRHFVFDYSNVYEISDTDRKSFSGNGELDYAYYANSAKFQTKINAGTLIGFSKFNNSGDWVEDEENSDFDSRLSFDYDVKFFGGNNNWFLTANPSGDFSYSKEKDFINEMENQNTRYYGALGLGGGKGRIEQVQDVRHALLILEEIENMANTNRKLTEAEVYELSSLISELKNERVFDARKRKIADLTTVDSFLVAKGIVNDVNDVAYFVGLEDMWVYGDLQVRESGNQIKLLIKPDYGLNKREFSTNDFRLEVFSLTNSLEFLVCKPISKKWQTNYDFGIQYIYTDKLVEDDIQSGTAKHNSRAYSKADIGFFPNTRTSFYVNGQMVLSNLSDEDLFDDEGYAFRFYLGTYAYYYISERLRLEGSIVFNSDRWGIFNDVENSIDNFFRYGISLNYAIF